MGEPFKNQINPDLIRSIGNVLKEQWSEFDIEGFVATATADLENLELKERSLAIVAALEAYLPAEYSRAAAIINEALDAEERRRDNEEKRPVLRGWAVIAMQEYVGRHGLDHLDLSLGLLRKMTIGSSSEFGIRYFLDTYQLETLKTMQLWVKDPNEHVRRLVSEGTRPRLPWGMQLKTFIKDPSPIIPLLEVLKDDPSEYVRRSVSNNLNDISKDHPGIVCKIAKSWMQGASEQRKRLIRHALRTLIKKGHSDALALVGVSPVQLKTVSLKADATVKLGESLKFTVEMVLKGDEPANLLIDYIIHHRKANGTLSPKVFKWKQLEVKPGQKLKFSRSHSFREVTVRKYYPGAHEVELLVNGAKVAKAGFDLITTD